MTPRTHSLKMIEIIRNMLMVALFFCVVNGYNKIALILVTTSYFSMMIMALKGLVSLALLNGFCDFWWMINTFGVWMMIVIVFNLILERFNDREIQRFRYFFMM